MTTDFGNTLLDNLESLPVSLVISLIFFVIGSILGTVTGYNIKKWFTLNSEKDQIDQAAFLKFFITVVVTLAWTGSILIELIDRTFSTNIILHLIMGMLVGGVVQVDFSKVLSSFGYISIKKENDKDNHK